MDNQPAEPTSERWSRAFPQRLREVEAAMLRLRRRAAAAAGLVDAARIPIDDEAGGKQAFPDDTVGVALSGGGIRSATFSLGFFQALADANLLGKIDYVSTVSGGGYFGGFLLL